MIGFALITSGKPVHSAVSTVRSIRLYFPTFRPNFDPLSTAGFTFKFQHSQHLKGMIAAALLTLYVPILAPILSEWISDEDLCYLDTAVCSHQLRSYLLRVMKQCNIINTDTDNFDKIKTWVTKRRLGVRKCDVEELKAGALSIFKNKHLQFLSSGDGKKLIKFLTKTKVTADAVELMIYFTPLREIQIVGHRLTHIVFDKFSKSDTQYPITVAKACPNLRSLIPRDHMDIWPFLEHCPHLEEILECNLKWILTTDRNLWTYFCDLMRTTVMDESAVCLGEGKYFNMTGLTTLDGLFTQEDRVMLMPLVKHLTSLSTEDFLLLTAAAEYCFHLNKIYLHPTPMTKEITRRILEQSGKLQEISITAVHNGEEQNANFLVEAVAIHCPLLQCCSVHALSIDDVSLSLLLQKTGFKELFIAEGHNELRIVLCPRNKRSSILVSGEVSKELVKLTLKMHKFQKIDISKYKLVDDEIRQLCEEGV